MGSSLSSDVRKIPPEDQVFISFRGKELRGGFVSFLVPALRKENVNLFIDEAEMRSSDLQNLFERIEESSFAVVVFSELFTESKWCLNELVKINERMVEGKLKVIPIFYKVTVEDVKMLEGNFGINFRQTKRKHQSELARTRNWEEALHSIPQKFGFASSEYRTDYDLLNAIVVEVKKLLKHIPTEEIDAAKVNDYRKVMKNHFPSQVAAVDDYSKVELLRRKLLERHMKVIRATTMERTKCWKTLCPLKKFWDTLPSYSFSFIFILISLILFLLYLF